MVKLSRPLGIAVMTLLLISLQYTAADGKNMPRRRRQVATRRGYKSYTGAAAHGWHRGKVHKTSRSEHAGREGSVYGDLRAMRLLRVHDRCGCAGGRRRPMLGRGRPYSSLSAVVKLSKPLGIAVMALFCKRLQYHGR